MSSGRVDAWESSSGASVLAGPGTGGEVATGSTTAAAWRVPAEELVEEINIISQTIADVVDQVRIGPRLSVEARRHRRSRLNMTCLVLGLVSPGSGGLRHGSGLLELSQFVRASVRKSDLVARYGNDALAVVLSGETIQGGMMVARRLTSEWRAQLADGDLAADAGIAAGLACLGECTWDGELLVYHAYVALLKASEAGPNEISHYAPAEHGVPAVFEVAPHLRAIKAEFPSLLKYLSNPQLSAALKALERHRPGVDVRNAWRVTTQSMALARKARLAQDEQVAVGVASLMRDIGMARVPAPILIEKGPLNREARDLIHAHPGISAAMVRETMELSGAAEQMIRHHHEWMDGSGYPAGLSREQIPLGARVIAVADAYVAMTSERAYRPAYSTERACDLLRQGTGSQFDPELVRTFLETL